MKAITHGRYGDPTGLVLTEVPDPVPGPGEVLVRIRAASLNPSDWHRVTGTPLIARLESGLRRPKRPIPGTDLAGTIEAVGSGVAPAVVAVGDDVFGWKHGAALAEFAAVPVDQLVPKPENASFVEAAATGIAAFTALQALRDKAGLQSDHHVLITGAGGGIGTLRRTAGRLHGCRGHRGVQRGEGRPRAFARRRPGHRLRNRGRARRSWRLRRDARHRREPPPAGLPSRR